MAPCTSDSRLLRAAAVLLVTAACARADTTAQMQTIFPFDKIEAVFEVLRERQCLPSDFQTPAIGPEINKCTSKVLSGDVPDECDGVPELAQAHICMANSNDHIVNVDGKKTFNISHSEEVLFSFTKDEEWNRKISSIIDSCDSRSTESLGPEEQAVYNYMCITFKLYADCDNQQDRRGALDKSALARRENFLQFGIKTLMEALGAPAEEAACAPRIYPGGDEAQRYADLKAAAICTLQHFNNDDGLIHPYGVFVLAAAKYPDQSAGLQELADACGPRGRLFTAEEFVDFWFNDVLPIYAGYESYLVASAIPESCVISL